MTTKLREGKAGKGPFKMDANEPDILRQSDDNPASPEPQERTGEQLEDLTNEELMNRGKAGYKALSTLQSRLFNKSVDACKAEYSNCGDPITIATKAWDNVRARIEHWNDDVDCTFLTWFRTVLKNTAIDVNRKKSESTLESMQDRICPPDFDAIPVAEIFIKVLLTRKTREQAIIRTRYWGDPGNGVYSTLEMNERACFEALLLQERTQSGKKLIPPTQLALWMYYCFVQHKANTIATTAKRHSVSVAKVHADCLGYRQDVGRELDR